MTLPARPSRLALNLALAALLVALGVGAGPRPAPEPAAASPFQAATLARWCDSHPERDGLQVVSIDVRFHAEPPLFVQSEGIVVAPVGLDLVGAQQVLESEASPAPLRKLTSSGVHAMAWEYPGRLHRELRYQALSLVSRPPITWLTLPAKPTFASLPKELSWETQSPAAALGNEHQLKECADFHDWAVRTAGEPPHTEQILRLAQAVSRQSAADHAGEDLCAALRTKQFTPHGAQVLVVMAAREVHAPSLGFAAASPSRIHLVGTWVDGIGWVFLDVEKAKDAWFVGGPPLVSAAPQIGGFEASSHDLWSPEAGAYASGSWGTQSLSGTHWEGQPRSGPDYEPIDTTAASVRTLAEACR